MHTQTTYFLNVYVALQVYAADLLRKHGHTDKKDRQWHTGYMETIKQNVFSNAFQIFTDGFVAAWEIWIFTITFFATLSTSPTFAMNIEEDNYDNPWCK